MKYVLYTIAYIISYLVAMIIAPILPLFASRVEGPIDNSNGVAIEPRLPNWLYWFSTNKDNSLYGDAGWRRDHCPKYNTYFGMVKWLWRNPAAGFSWSVLSIDPKKLEFLTVDCTKYMVFTSIDKSHCNNAWFKISSVSNGAFQYRLIKTIGKFKFCFEAGWLLDVYLKDKDAFIKHPKAQFIFQPQLKILA